MLQLLRLCRTSDTVFRREINSRRQWGYGTCYGGIVSPLRRSVGLRYLLLFYGNRTTHLSKFLYQGMCMMQLVLRCSECRDYRLM